MHVYTCSKIARVRAVCTARYTGHAVGSCVWKCSEGRDDFFFVLVSEGFYGERGGGGVGVHFVQCARVRLSQRVDLRVKCEMRGMRIEVAGLLNFGGKTYSEVN
jgi:hypothetical protein